MDKSDILLPVGGICWRWMFSGLLTRRGWNLGSDFITSLVLGSCLTAEGDGLLLALKLNLLQSFVLILANSPTLVWWWSLWKGFFVTLGRVKETELWGLDGMKVLSDGMILFLWKEFNELRWLEGRDYRNKKYCAVHHFFISICWKKSIKCQFQTLKICNAQLGHPIISN